MADYCGLEHTCRSGHSTPQRMLTLRLQPAPYATAAALTRSNKQAGLVVPGRQARTKIALQAFSRALRLFKVGLDAVKGLLVGTLRIEKQVQDWNNPQDAKDKDTNN